MHATGSVVYVQSGRMSQRKRTVIDILRASPGYVSGERISATLGISRNAVHKHVKALRARGYTIVGVSRRGYKLEEEPSRLVMPVITEMTRHSLLGRSFRYYDEIESTNLEAKSLAVDGAPEGTVVIAETQTAGRGRLGRRWLSPAGKGLLFSVVLRPAIPMADAHLLTLVAAVATAEAVEDQAGLDVSIKWPNDLFLGDRKVGGILLEVSGEQDEVDWIVVGIGINVNTEYAELPVPLRRSAVSLKMAGGAAVDRSELLARILLALEAHYVAAVREGFDRALSGFRSRDYLRARTVSVCTREGSIVGEATGIDDRGALLVELPHRHVRRFHAGDVSLHAS